MKEENPEYQAEGSTSCMLPLPEGNQQPLVHETSPRLPSKVAYGTACGEIIFLRLIGAAYPSLGED